MSRAIYASYPGFGADEIRTDRPAEQARLKWTVVVDETLSPGRAVNAAACVGAATAPLVAGLLGAAAKDGDGSLHPGLPWLDCVVLRAPAAELSRLRAEAAMTEGFFVADMPEAAQQTRVYDDYLNAVARTRAPGYAAIGIIGPRDRVSAMTGALSLLR